MPILKHRLPPLISIEAFVTTARLLSFSKAALQLNITQSAVTRRIQALEADLGVQLFDRTRSGLILTTQGARYLAGVGPAFDQLYQSNLSVRRMGAGKAVRLRIASSVAWAWLARDLMQFRRDLPDIDLEFESASEDGSFVIDDVDMMLSFGRREHWPDLHARELADIKFQPLASPQFCSAFPASIDPDAFARLPLIGLAQIPQAWETWFSEAGYTRDSAAPVYLFDNLQVGYAAAASGLGVALGSQLLCGPYLKAGELMPLAPRSLSIGLRFHLIMRFTERDNRIFRQVADWLAHSLARWAESPSAM